MEDDYLPDPHSDTDSDSSSNIDMVDPVSQAGSDTSSPELGDSIFVRTTLPLSTLRDLHAGPQSLLPTKITFSQAQSQHTCVMSMSPWTNDRHPDLTLTLHTSREDAEQGDNEAWDDDWTLSAYTLWKVPSDQSPALRALTAPSDASADSRQIFARSTASNDGSVVANDARDHLSAQINGLHLSSDIEDDLPCFILQLNKQPDNAMLIRIGDTGVHLDYHAYVECDLPVTWSASTDDEQGDATAHDPLSMVFLVNMNTFGSAHRDASKLITAEVEKAYLHSNAGALPEDFDHMDLGA